MTDTGFAQDFSPGCSAAETITGMRVDIGEMRADMRHLAQQLTAYMERNEACQADHEARLRAVETAAIAVQKVADLERRVGSIETTLAETAGQNRTIGYLKDIALGLVGALVGLAGGGWI